MCYALSLLSNIGKRPYLSLLHLLINFQSDVYRVSVTSKRKRRRKLVKNITIRRRERRIADIDCGDGATDWPRVTF